MQGVGATAADKTDFTRRLLVEAGVAAAMRVLDIGCGSGDVTLLIATLVGETGSVVGIDRDERVLAKARERVLPQGLQAPSFVRTEIGALPETLGMFDAIVGRRVLMYQPDAVQAVRTLAERLRGGGVVVFQEHDTNVAPTSLVPRPLHARAQHWLRSMIEKEGADLYCGFNLYGILTRAGLSVEDVRAEAIVQTPASAYQLGWIVRSCLPRIIALGVATAEEVEIDTLQTRLDAERLETDSIYLGGMIFGAWARKPRDADESLALS